MKNLLLIIVIVALGCKKKADPAPEQAKPMQKYSLQISPITPYRSFTLKRDTSTVIDSTNSNNLIGWYALIDVYPTNKIYYNYDGDGYVNIKAKKYSLGGRWDTAKIYMDVDLTGEGILDLNNLPR